MPVLHLDPEHFKREYGALCHRYFPQQTLTTPFGASYCVIGAGESTDPHQHHEGETFFIVKGQGEMTIAGEAPARVAAGDIVYNPPHTPHVLRNTDAANELVLFSVWWEDGTAPTRQLTERSLVIVAAPTPNGKLHLGHLSGPYVAADVYTRYLRLRQVKVGIACGSDDNQSYTATKGMQLGMTPEAVTVKFGDANEATLANMNVAVDYFLRPVRTPGFPEFVEAFLEKLLNDGTVVPRQVESLWCEACNLYLYEAHVKGGCPHCGEPTSGNGCEACALPNACVDLVEPRCGHCQAPATRQTHEQLFFALEPFRAQLETFFDEVTMSPHLRAIADTVLSRPMEPVAVSHYSSWGQPVPGRPGQVIFEFLEMAAGFLWQAAKVAPSPAPDGDGWRWAFHEPGAEVVQFLGIDNTFYFMVLMPALLRAFDPEIRLPRSFVCNEFFQLEGKKFSTSRGHAIWGDEALEHVPADALRYAVALNRPEHEQTSFSLAALERVVQEDLVEGLEAWLAELDRKVVACGRVAPTLGAMTAAERAFAERLRGYAQTLAGAYDVRDFSMRRAARTLKAFVADARDFGKGHQHLAKGLPGRYETALAVELAAAHLFAVVASPLLPAACGRLLEAMGKQDATSWTTELVPFAPGQVIGSLLVTNFAAAARGARDLAKERVPADLVHPAS